MTSQFARTGSLIRLALRRDRVLLPAWILGFAAIAGVSAGATVGLYPQEAQRVQAAEAVNSTSSLVALYGPIYDTTSLGALSLFKLTAMGAAVIAVLMVFITVRHTRAEEESGQLELVAAGPVGRYAPLAAALTVAVGGSLTLGLATAIALTVTGLPVAGSLLFGLGWGLSGAAFAALAGVVAQITTGARAARGLTMIGIVVAYGLRAVGDLASAGGWLSWLSPIGWMQQVRAFAGDRWWVLLLPALMTAVCVPLALLLRSRRDVGAGLLRERPGPSEGSLAGVFSLAWRLQRGGLFAWALMFVFFGFLLGSLADTLTGFLDSPQAAEYLAMLGGTGTLTEIFLSAELSILGIVVTAYGIEAASRLGSEEAEGHVEVLLSAPVSRLRWWATHLLIAASGVLVIMALTGMAVGAGVVMATGDTGMLTTTFTAALARVPAAWLFTGLVVAAFGWMPRRIALVWGLFALALAIGEFGPLWDAPQWLMDLSPFVHSPRLPAPDSSLGGLLPLIVVSVVLTLAGLLGWRRRDVPA
ncbi:MAG TPA: ABC transporter permease [Actinomycetota bacterium]|nr:ABC transporter permease [Actinomycetota bacterium]